MFANFRMFAAEPDRTIASILSTYGAATSSSCQFNLAFSAQKASEVVNLTRSSHIWLCHGTLSGIVVLVLCAVCSQRWGELAG